jgi:hypothetical protein
MSYRMSQQSRPPSTNRFVPDQNLLEPRLLLSGVFCFPDVRCVPFLEIARLPRTGGVSLNAAARHPRG